MTDDDELAVRRAEQDLLRAIGAGDVGALAALLDDDCIFTDQSGRRVTKEEDLSLHRSGFLKVDLVQAIEEPVVRTFDGCAVVATRLRLSGRFGDTPFSGDFAYTRVWRRTDARWVVAAAHASAIAATGSTG